VGTKAPVRFSRRGRERAWWLVAIAVTMAAAWAVGSVLQWPVAIRAMLAGLGALVAGLVPELRARRAQDDARDRLLAGRLSVPATGRRLPRVRDVSLDDLRVHIARVHVPYIDREAQASIETAVRERRPVLIVGHSMAGKTRLAAHVVKELLPEAPLLMPESGRALRELVDAGLDTRGTVVWLDDLERFLATDGLTTNLLRRLTNAGAVIVATVRTNVLNGYRPRDAIRPSEWDAVGQFSHVGLDRTLQRHELDRVRAAISDQGVLAAVERYGLAEYLGAGPEAVDQFRRGETISPVGRALVSAAVDWRRVGMIRPAPKQILIAALPHYLAGRDDVPRDAGAVEQGLTWATEKINETVALLIAQHSQTERITEPEYEVFEYLIDHLIGIGAPIPDGMWRLALEQATSAEMTSIGLAAYFAGKPQLACTSWLTAAAAGEPGATSNLGVLLKMRGATDRAEQLFRRAATAGDAAAMLNLGDLLRERGDNEQAEHWTRRGAEAGHFGAMSNLGVLLQERGDKDQAEQWFRRAADAGHPLALCNLGVLLQERGDKEQAEQWFWRAADAGDASAMLALGELFSERGETDQANKIFRRAVEAGHAGEINNLGVLLNIRGEVDKAKQLFGWAAEAGHPGAMNNLGGLLRVRGETEQAEQWYRRAAEVNDTDAISNLGTLLMEQGKVDEAEQWLRRAAEVGHVIAMSNLGVLLIGRGAAVEAEQWLQHAAEADDTTAMYNLSLILEQQGKTDEAQHWLRRAGGDNNQG
jgi:TPR repeat protein